MSETAKKRYVVGFLIQREEFRTDGKPQKVLLIKKEKPVAWAGKYTGPGGKIEGKETPAEAMSREFREETGINIKPKDWKHTVFLETGDFTLDFFVASGRPHTARQMETETLEVADINNLPANMFSNARWALPISLDDRMEFPLRLQYAGVESPVDAGAKPLEQTPPAPDAATAKPGENK